MKNMGLGAFVLLSGTLIAVGCGGGGPAEPLSFVPPSCSAQRAPFGGGEGSQDSPYTICTAEHLNAVSGALSSAFLLVEEINLAELEAFSIIGSEEEPFTGHFDGAELVIRGLRLDWSEDETFENQVGLFGFIGEEGVVRDVILEDVEVVAAQFVGALAGVNQGEISGARVSGVVFEVGTQALPGKSIGGLVGLNQGRMTDSHSSASVRGSEETGGLVGTNEGVVRRSHSTGSVTGSGACTGGLVGVSHGEVSESSAEGGVESLSTGERMYRLSSRCDQQGVFTAGLVGMNHGSITDSHATGDVQGGSFSGGLVGINYSEVRDSYATGNVKGDSTTGGLVAINFGEIVRSYSEGEVRGGTTGGLVGESHGGAIRESFSRSNVHSSEDSAGGLVAENHLSVIESSTAYGDVENTGSGYTGGFVGRSVGDLTDCHAEGDVVGQGPATGGLVGRSGGVITRSSARGRVSGTSEVMGGLIGVNTHGTIDRSFSLSDVDGATYVGGLVGEFGGKADIMEIRDSYALGAVSGSVVGGLIGHCRFITRVTHSFASGALASTEEIGGLVGAAPTHVHLGRCSTSNSYWDAQTSGASTSPLGSALTTAAFEEESTFRDWDFENVWVIDEAADGVLRPQLRWQP